MTRDEVERIRAVASERFYKADKRSDKSRESTIIRLCDALVLEMETVEEDARHIEILIEQLDRMERSE